MGNIQVKDKEFRLLISEEDVVTSVKRLAEKISEDLEGKNPLFLAVLNGSFMFASDLVRNITTPCEICFVKMASYHDGMRRTGNVTEVFGLSENIEGRTLVVVEDIVDTGHTIWELLNVLASRRPAEVRVAAFLSKPGALQCKVPLHYVAFEIPNDFVVGYGLDYAGYGRNYGGVYTLVE